jgi:Tol biopolymer transport system component
VDLWYSDIYGKKPHKATETGKVRDYDWLADSKGLIYIDNSDECTCEIYLVKLDEHHHSCVFKSDSMYGCKALSVSPDGCYAAFIGTNKCSDDIYVYDIEKDKLCNITNHRNSLKIASIAWNADSGKIYYAAKDSMYYDIYSVDIETSHNEYLTNTTSSYMQLAYRPRIK